MNSSCKVLAGPQKASDCGCGIFSLPTVWVLVLHMADGLLCLSFPKNPVSLYC